MTQQTLIEFDTHGTQTADRIGFEIGWDHARHGLVPDAAWMQPGAPVGQGWHAARAVFGRRTLAAARTVRVWLALRLQAWCEGAVFEGLQVTPHYLAQIESSHCPVTRRALGGLPGGDDEARVVRLRADAGYAAGNLVGLSRAAQRAIAGRNAADVLALAQRLAREAEPAAVEGLDAAAWARLATLMALAVELAQAQAARLPMHALPPNRVRVLSPAQGLQALLTMRFSAPGWSRRARAVADLLPRPELRHDFNLFVGAIAPRLMALPVDATPQAARWAQEDAWADLRVQRRWQQFAVQMTAAETELLLQRVAEAGLGGMRLLMHEAAAATEGWSLGSQGRLVGSPRRAAPGFKRASAGAARAAAALPAPAR